MAKIRVYELAKNLNMTNKALLTKMEKMNISVGSHMSSLDDSTVELIKTNLFGKKESEHDEKRIKSTVIRRRKKSSEDEGEPVAAEAPAELKESPAKKMLDEEPATEPVKEQTEEKPLEEEPDKLEAKVDEEETTAVPDVENEVSDEPPVQEVPVRKPADQPAKIIKKVQPAEEKPEESVQEKESPAELPVEESGETEQVADEATHVETVQQEVEVKKPAVAPEEDDEAKQAVQKKKKKKKFTAAKIIKLPEPGAAKPAVKPTEAPKQAPVKQPDVPVQPQAQMEDKPAEKPYKKGKKQKAAPGDDDLRFSKKKSKRKTVVEGNALYASGRGRKGRKGAKGSKGKQAEGQKTQITTPKAIKRRIKVDDTIILAELAKRMGIKASEMIAKLMGLGVMATVNQTIDFDTATMVASEFSFDVERASFEEDILLNVDEKSDDPGKLSPRPPVVTIMGHVDHGKTSLLDVIRKSTIADGEAGGITQHIGAYNVETQSGQVVFLDTPGHEAFTSMRARGAKVTDIVILVVAADDGVMPQTIEALNHAKAAEVPIIVAVNKIDKEGADPDRVKRELSDHGVVSEDWGGDTIFVHVSAKQKIGISDLLEMILLQAEVLELKANPDKFAVGHVVESKLDSGRGPLATILVQEGTLKTGQSIVCGIHYGKIRAMFNDQGKQVNEAGPSIPVEVIGLTGVPEAGDELVALAADKDAKQVSLHRSQKARSKELAKNSRLSLEGLFEQMEEGVVKDLNLIIKADVHGSIEALKESLGKLATSEVKINVIHSATGTVSESDVSLAAVSNAIILGFNVRPATKVQELSKEENVDMRFYDIIYDAIKDLKDAMVGLMESTFNEVILGRAEVRDTFVIPKKGTIAGCFVSEGLIKRGQRVRLLRDGVIVYDGNIASLKRFKDDAKEVLKGYECGIGIENFNDIKLGDTIDCYMLEEVKPTLD